MLRFIVKNEFLDSTTQQYSEGYTTLDIDVPELEELLKRGGYGNGGYEQHTLIGIDENPKPYNA